MTDHEKEVERIVDLLGCSIVEAEQVLADDKAIDKGQRMSFDLSKEEEKKALKLANVREHKKPAVYKWDTKERKADTTKEGVIQQIFEFLVANGYENVEILNKSKLIGFKIADDNSVETVALPVSNKVIVVDAGHGVPDERCRE